MKNVLTLVAASFVAVLFAASLSFAADSESFGGLGITILPSQQGVQVVGVIPNSPADLAGIQKGDQVTAVNGVVLSGSFDARRDMLRGEAGSEAVLSVSRAGASLEMNLTRIALSVQPIAASTVADWYGRDQGLTESELNYLASREDASLLSVMQNGLPLGSTAENLSAQNLQGVYTTLDIAPDVQEQGRTVIQVNPGAQVRMLNANGRTAVNGYTAQYPVATGF
jgi:membrane-associated protease RseP (regulator of RpoE activity)